jgi:hypothetical protein
MVLEYYNDNKFNSYGAVVFGSFAVMKQQQIILIICASLEVSTRSQKLRSTLRVLIIEYISIRSR